MAVELKKLTPESLAGKIKSVNLLGLKSLVKCENKISANGLTITVPAKTRVPSDIAYVFKIETE